MELLSAFGIGVLCALSSSAPIGPVSLGVVQATITKGRPGGIAVAMGGVLADVVYALVAWFISDLIVGDEDPVVFKWLNYLSIPVVLFLGYKMIKSRNEDHSARPLRAHNKVFHGFVLGVSNPGLLVYWLGAIAFAQAGGWLGHSSLELVMFITGVVGGILGALTLLIVAASVFAKRVSERLVSNITLFLGIAFLGFGAFLIGRVLVLYVF